MVKLSKIVATTVSCIFTLNILILPAFSQGQTVQNNGKNPNQTGTVQKGAGLETAAESAIMIEQSTGKILYDKNSHERRPLASITKVMTLLLAMEAIDSGKLKLTDKITCSEHAASMGGSTICFGVGEQLSVDDVLKGIAVSSGNDAAVAMAEKLGGSEENFVKMMNAKAQALGMKDSHFMNACGLDEDNHYSSAYDISIMSRELLKHPLFTKYSTIWSGHLTYPMRKDPKKRDFSLFNTNKLIRFYQGANGIKTGSTGKAKFCVSAAAKRNGMQLIAVVMACKNNKERFKEASTLLNYGFANYEVSNILSKGKIVGQTNVDKGKQPSVKVEAAGDLSILREKGQNADVKKELCLYKVEAPINKGQVVGYVLCKDSSGKQVGKVKVTAYSSVGKMGVRESLEKIFNSLFSGK